MSRKPILRGAGIGKEELPQGLTLQLTHSTGRGDHGEKLYLLSPKTNFYRGIVPILHLLSSQSNGQLYTTEKRKEMFN